MNEFAPTIVELQQDVVDGITKVKHLASRAADLMPKGQREEWVETSLLCDQAIDHVKNLELQAAIVAPMSAGKSTIINAIVGENVLPVRNSAMTSVPTRIRFSDTSEPELEIPAALVEQVRQYCELIHMKLRDDPEAFTELIEKKPELSPIQDRVKSGDLHVYDTAKGDEIEDCLVIINDVFRFAKLAGIAAPPPLKKGHLILPEVKVPRRSRIFPRGRLPFGQLVVIDSPGPNEAGAGLRAVVKDVLDRANMVLVVIDYTKIDDESAEEIALQIRPYLKQVGAENILVLVNKFDQYRSGDASLDTLKGVVKSQLAIPEDQLKDRMFSISARWAMAADRFISIFTSPEGEKREESLDSARSALEEEDPFGDDETEDEEWLRKAEALWKNSKFEKFLDGSISSLLEKAGSLALRGETSKCCEWLQKLTRQCSGRLQSLSGDIETLKRSLDLLSQELQLLDQAAESIKSKNDLQTQVFEEIDGLILDSRRSAFQQIEALFDTEKARVDHEKPIVQRFINRLKKLKERLIPGEKKIEFPDEESASEFENESLAAINEIIGDLGESGLDMLSEKVQNHAAQVQDDISSKFGEVMERAVSALNREFPGVIEPGDLPDLDLDEFTEGMVEKENKIHQTPETVWVRRWWHWLWIVPRKEIIQRSETRTVQVIHLDTLKDKALDQLGANASKLKEGIHQHLGEYFETRVRTAYDAVRDVLNDYRKSLEPSEEDQKMDLKKKEGLINDTTALRDESRALAEQFTKLQRRIKTIGA